MVSNGMLLLLHHVAWNCVGWLNAEGVPWKERRQWMMGVE